jgi:hypothetical protein
MRDDRVKKITLAVLALVFSLCFASPRYACLWASPVRAQRPGPGDPNNSIYVQGRAYPYTESGLRSALSTAGANASVWVPRGRIQLSSPLRIPSSGRIYWDGVTLFSGGFDGDLVQLTDVSNVSFDGKLIIDGAGAGAASTSEGLVIAGVRNFTFSDIEIRNTLNNCLEIIGSSHIRGSRVYGIKCGSPKPPGGGGDTLFISNYHSSREPSKDVASSDIQISQIDADTTGQQNCVFISGDDAAPTLRVNIDSINVIGCADEGVELDYCEYCNLGKITVQGVPHEGVLLRQTLDDQINSVVCSGSGLAICVDVARYRQVGAPPDGFSGNITIVQVIADGVNGDPVNGAAVRISNSDASNRISNVVIGQIVAVSSTRGFYCVGGKANIVQHVSLSNISITKSGKDGILINGCSDVQLGTGNSYDNGQSGRGFAALHGTDAADVVIGGMRLFDDQKSKTQSYGILTEGTSDRWTIGDADVRDDLEIVSGLSLAGSHNVVSDGMKSRKSR